MSSDPSIAAEETKRITRRHFILSNPDGTSRGSTRITFERVRNVFVNHCVSIVALDDLSIRLVGLKGLPQRIVKAMGEEWEQMYDESHIQRVMSRFLSAKGWPI